MIHPLRICLIGDFSGHPDEGMKNISYHLNKHLSIKNKVLTFNPTDSLSPVFWNNIRKFNPQIIHYLHGPSIKSFILVKVLRLFFRSNKTRTLLLAPRPEITHFSKHFIPFLRPDLILTQSHKSDKFFSSFNCNTRMLLGGVDVNKFIPVSPQVKKELRSKYGFNKNTFIVLHVGHFRTRRNVDILCRIQKEAIADVVMIGGTSLNFHKEVYDQLKECGCKTIHKFLPNIEEFFQLADCYIFTVKDTKASTLPSLITGSIELPLTVLQAMACNLPIISTKFGVLPHIFSDGIGFSFYEKEEDALNLIKSMKISKKYYYNREFVMKYSWENMTQSLENIYSNLLYS